jgi:TetR/AcrR family transcriptional regulator, mexJK operon transcriptional repressor
VRAEQPAATRSGVTAAGEALAAASGPGPPSRSARKRGAIAKAAATVFLRDGYVSASMDEVAAVAGVSKQTVYKHFGNKEQLFLAVINEVISGVLDEFFAALATSFPDSEDLEGDFIRLGRILLTRVLDPGLMAVRRLVIAEVGRFPQLGRAWYESGPGGLATALSASLRRLAERGQLRIEDPAAAASDFNWLVVSKPQNMILFGVVESFTAAEIEQFVASAVEVFLAAYRPAGVPASSACDAGDDQDDR